MEGAPKNNNGEPVSTQWDSLSDFSRERNINDKTGKKRTFSEFDIYPKRPGETNKEYGARLRFMHQKTAEYREAEAAREAEEKLLASEQSQQEPQAEAKEVVADKPQWDPRLTPEQIDDMIQRDIYEPVGQAYEQALREFGIKDVTTQAQTESKTVTESVGERQSITDKNGIRTDGYLASEQGKKELESEAEFDRLAEKLEQAVKEGRITEEHAKALMAAQLNKAINAIDGVRQDYEDRRAVGTPEEQAAYEEWLKSRDAENIENRKRREEEERAKLEEEERAKLEEEERAKLEEEERKKLELEKKIKEKEEKEKRLAEIDEELKPLVAINADFTHDMKELAFDYADRLLNMEKEKDGLIKRLWKHKYFRKYYQKKYERQLLSGERKVGEDKDGDVTLEDVVEGRSDSAIERFVLGATEDMRYINEKIGKNDGEKLTEADKETTELVRGAIERFAQAKIPEDGTLEDLRREFGNEIRRMQAEARDQGRNIDAKLINNYFEVAKQARQRVEHGIAMDKVMEGFKVYNADVRNGVRSQAHRDNIDKIVNRFESSKIGQFIPAEIVAAALGSVWAIAQKGAGVAARIAVPIGGIAVSGALAGLRERNRVTEERTRMMRDIAVGLEYQGMTEEEAKDRRAKKRARYEAKIGGTRYDMQPASKLTEGINEAIESGDEATILRAIADARVRIDFSNSEEKDLISYSSEEKVGDERTRLYKALITAENRLSDEGKKKLESIKAVVLKEVNNNVDKSDRNFKKIRTAQAVKQAGKTVAIGSAVFFASQEIMSIIDPNKIGLFEKAGLIKTHNNETAQETILAGLAGPRVRTETYTDTIDNVSNPKEIQQLEKDGYSKTMTKPAWSGTRKIPVDVDPSKSTAQVPVAYDDWANNGTTFSDGNELRMYLNDGQISSGMFGTSTAGSRIIDYDAASSAGNIRLYLTFGNSKFDIVSKINSLGQRVWGNNGVFTTTTGETIKAIGDNGEWLFKSAEIAVRNGVDANGVTHITPLATIVGNDSFAGTIRQIVEIPVEHPPIYKLTKTIVEEFPRDVSYGGVFVAPTSRVGLGGPRARGAESGNDGGGDSTVIVDTIGEKPPEMITGTEAEEIADNVENDTATDNGTGETQGSTTSNAAGANAIVDSTSGTNAGETSPTGQPAEEQPDQTANQTAEDKERSELADRIRGEFGDSINNDIVELMTDKSSGLDDETATRITGLWGKLSQDTRNKLIDYYNREDPPYGQAFKVFVKNQSPPPAATGNVAA